MDIISTFDDSDNYNRTTDANDPDKALRDFVDNAEIYKPSNGDDRQDAQASLGIKVWRWRDPRTIPPRPWLLGNLLIRGEVTGLGGTGGRGKTALLISLMLASITGRNLTGHHPHKRCRWLYLHLEEDDDEFDRRVVAAMIHHGIDPSEVDGMIHHRPIGAGLVIARDENGGMVAEPVFEALQEYATANGVDVICVDPMIVTYQGDENSNKTRDQVTRKWKEAAAACRCSVAASQHFRKGTASPGDPDSFRGGSSFIDATRGAYTLVSMSEQEANTLGIKAEERDQFIRLDSAKRNMSKKERETWYRLASVDLGNSTDDYPNGDNVQAIERWEPPDAFADLSTSKAREIVLAIDAGMEDGERYTDKKHGDNERWAGNIIIEMTGKTENAAKKMLATWLEKKVLKADDYNSEERRRKRRGLWANLAKLPGTEHD